MPKLRKVPLARSRAKPYSSDNQPPIKKNKSTTKLPRTAVAPKKTSQDFAELYVEELRKEFKLAANPTKAVAMKQYMRNQFEMFGIQSPERRAITKQVAAQFPDPTFKDLKSLLLLLWQQQEREFLAFGVDYATQHMKVLSAEGATALEGVVRNLLTTQSWWDTVDILATGLVGHMVQDHPTTCVPVMDKWIESDNMWLRRTAILHQLKYKTATDQERLFRYCMKCSHETEFFIQKAIGWALREYHKTKRTDVQNFVRKNKESLAKLSVREALKHA